MVGRLAHLLLVLVVVMAAAFPPPARALPNAPEMDWGGMDGAGVTAAGMTDCSACPRHDRTGPHAQSTCPAMSCAIAAATLPVPVLLPVRLARPGPAYRTVRSTAWTGALQAPDPFPPRNRSRT